MGKKGVVKFTECKAVYQNGDNYRATAKAKQSTQQTRYHSGEQVNDQRLHRLFFAEPALNT